MSCPTCPGTGHVLLLESTIRCPTCNPAPELTQERFSSALETFKSLEPATSEFTLKDGTNVRLYKVEEDHAPTMTELEEGCSDEDLMEYLNAQIDHPMRVIETHRILTSRERVVVVNNPEGNGYGCVTFPEEDLRDPEVIMALLNLACVRAEIDS